MDSEDAYAESIRAKKARELLEAEPVHAEPEAAEALDRLQLEVAQAVEAVPLTGKEATAYTCSTRRCENYARWILKGVYLCNRHAKKRARKAWRKQHAKMAVPK